MRFTNWDKYKDDRGICRKVGCGDEELKWCCPDLDCSLCKPKVNLLKKLEIKEKDLDGNLISVEDVKERIEIDKKELEHPFNYFVSYGHSNKSGHGFGMANIRMQHPIQSFQDVNTVKEIIEAQEITNVIILNYNLLED